MALSAGKVKRKLSHEHLFSQPSSSASNSISISTSSTTSTEQFLVQRHPLDPKRSLRKANTHLSTPSHFTIAGFGANHMSGVIDLTGSSPEPDHRDVNSIMRDIIDLTADDDSPEISNLGQSSDPQVALQLQAQYDKEAAQAYHQGSSNTTSKKMKLDNAPDKHEVGESIFQSDEEYAELLAAAFEQENRGEDEDAKLAMKMHLQWNDGVDLESQDEWVRHNNKSMFGDDDHAQRDASQQIADEASSLAALHEFGQKTLRCRCYCCNKPLIYDEGSIQRLSKRWSFQGLSSMVECNKCKNAFTCMGCGQPGSQHHSSSDQAPGTEKQPWCCYEGRLFLIWALLCSLKSNKIGKNCKILPTRPKSALSGKLKSGTGYADNARGPRGKASNTAALVDESDPMDGSVTFVLHNLITLLPSWNKNSRFDQEPPKTLLPMLKRSFLLEKVAELLRNDSIDNASKRKGLYISVVRFMNALAEHHVTASIAYEERTVYTDREGLFEVCFGHYSPSPNLGFENVGDKVQSLERTMQNLKVQAESFMKQTNAVDHEGFEPDQHTQDAIQLSMLIVNLAAYLRANALPDSAATTSALEDVKEWHRDNSVDEIPDDELLNGHYYANEANSVKIVQKGRMKRLMMELANLKTSLPEGVYVRHGSSRLDVMKVVIIGPKDTPYENGIFEFDLFCTGNYPNEAPKMKFKTTGGGRAHFNPNLYTDGKICLSLLGTWSGEPWRPGQSTLLQVFVSIQSMIFCDEPWCNEPGRESMAGSPQSISYNKSIRRLTLMYALLDWAKKQAEQPTLLSSGTGSVGNHIWTSVVEKHFSVNVETILETVGRWSNEGFGSSGHLRHFNTFGVGELNPGPPIPHALLSPADFLAVAGHLNSPSPYNLAPNAPSTQVPPAHKLQASVNPPPYASSSSSFGHQAYLTGIYPPHSFQASIQPGVVNTVSPSPGTVFSQNSFQLSAPPPPGSKHNSSSMPSLPSMQDIGDFHPSQQQTMNPAQQLALQQAQQQAQIHAHQLANLHMQQHPQHMAKIKAIHEKLKALEQKSQSSQAKAQGQMVTQTPVQTQAQQAYQIQQSFAQSGPPLPFHPPAAQRPPPPAPVNEAKLVAELETALARYRQKNKGKVLVP